MKTKHLKKYTEMIYSRFANQSLEILYWFLNTTEKDRNLFEDLLYYKDKALTESEDVYREHVAHFIMELPTFYPKRDENFFSRKYREYKYNKLIKQIKPGIIKKTLELQDKYCNAQKLKFIDSFHDLNLATEDNLFYNLMRSNYLINKVKEASVENWNNASEESKENFLKKVRPYIADFDRQKKLNNTIKSIEKCKKQIQNYQADQKLIKEKNISVDFAKHQKQIEDLNKKIEKTEKELENLEKLQAILKGKKADEN